MQKRFLIVKLSSLGDIIQAFPVAEYLKEKFPDCQIDWAVKEEYRSLIKAHPLINPGFSGKYDAIFDLQGNCRSSLYILKARGQKIGFGLKTVPEWPNCLVTHKKYNVDITAQISHQYLSLVKQYFQDDTPFDPKYIPLSVSEEDQAWVNSLGIDGATMLCPGSRWPNKQPDPEVWHPYLGEKNVLIWGTEKEKKLCKQIDPNATILGNLTFPRWQALMSKMKLVLCVDSCALHLAALANVPTLALFGPSSSTVYNPIGHNHQACQGTCPYGITFAKRCPKLRTCKTGACMNQFK